MNKQESKAAVEGEGSYGATRNYNQHLAESVESGGIEAAAEEALRAVEGPGGAELKRAEEQAKKGPAPAVDAVPPAKPVP